MAGLCLHVTARKICWPEASTTRQPRLVAWKEPSASKTPRALEDHEATAVLPTIGCRALEHRSASSRKKLPGHHERTMPASRAVSLVLVALRCPRAPAPIPKLHLPLQLHGATRQRWSVVFVLANARSARNQSTSASGQKPDRNPPPPRLSARLLLRALRQSLGNLGSTFRGQNLRILFRQNPEELIIALAVCVQLAILSARRDANSDRAASVSSYSLALRPISSASTSSTSIPSNSPGTRRQLPNRCGAPCITATTGPIRSWL